MCCSAAALLFGGTSSRGRPGRWVLRRIQSPRPAAIGPREAWRQLQEERGPRLLRSGFGQFSEGRTAWDADRVRTLKALRTGAEQVVFGFGDEPRLPLRPSGRRGVRSSEPADPSGQASLLSGSGVQTGGFVERSPSADLRVSKLLGSLKGLRPSSEERRVGRASSEACSAGRRRGTNVEEARNPRGASDLCAFRARPFGAGRGGFREASLPSGSGVERDRPSASLRAHWRRRAGPAATLAL